MQVWDKEYAIIISENTNFIKYTQLKLKYLQVRINKIIAHVLLWIPQCKCGNLSDYVESIFICKHFYLLSSIGKYEIAH